MKTTADYDKTTEYSLMHVLKDDDFTLYIISLSLNDASKILPLYIRIILPIPQWCPSRSWENPFWAAKQNIP